MMFSVVLIALEMIIGVCLQYKNKDNTNKLLMITIVNSIIIIATGVVSALIVR